MRGIQIGRVAFLCRSLQKFPLQQQQHLRSIQILSTVGRVVPLKQDHDEFTQHAEAKERAKERERKSRDEEEEIKTQILDAGLQHVQSLGWSRAALQAGAKQLGYPPTSSSVVPHADIGLVLHQYRTANHRLEQEMQKQVEASRAQSQPIKVGPFLKQNIVNRLRMNIPYMNKWPEALAIRAHPMNAPESLCLALELVDGLWHFAGDKATDVNWYTKRLSLLAIYKSTEVAMMQDKSEDYNDTWKFLERRFEDHFNLVSLINNCSSGDIEKVFGGLGRTVRILIGLPR